MARQQHGFNFENLIIQREGLIKSSNYTSKYDAYLKTNNAEIPVQIKLTTKKGEICLASYERNRTVCEDFILHLGFYSGKKDNITEEKTYFIIANKWKFACSYEAHDEMMSEMKLQTNLKADDDRWKNFVLSHQRRWNSTPDRFIRLRPKRDHKTQKRIQLAIPYADRKTLDEIFPPTSFDNIGREFCGLNEEKDEIMSKKYTKKSTLDKFYTKREIASNLISSFFETICPDDMKKIKIVLEPSAGSGSFSTQILSHVKADDMKIIAVDIEPAHESVECIDFMDCDLSDRLAQYTVAIGNPPFGKQCSHATRFFNKCAEYENLHYIGFILPSSFKKESVHDRLDLNFSLIKQIDLEPNAFILDSNQYDVPCIFQVWKRGGLRSKHKKYKPNDSYKFVKNIADANIAFRRVGVYAGKCIILSEEEKLSSQSHYFISTELDTNKICKEIEAINWPSNDTVGPRSISKNLLIKELNIITEQIKNHE
jgi:predicted RNA methylase